MHQKSVPFIVFVILLRLSFSTDIISKEQNDNWFQIYMGVQVYKPGAQTISHGAIHFSGKSAIIRFQKLTPGWFQKLTPGDTST